MTPNNNSTIGTAIVLAAGLSVRFGSDKKRIPFGNTTLLQFTVELYTRVFSNVHVVLNEGEREHATTLPAQAHPVYAASAHLGISQSLRTGVKHAMLEPWLVVGLMDMPYIAVETLALLARRVEVTSASAVRLSYQRQFGNPVGFKQDSYSQLCALSGDNGARTLLDNNALSVEVLSVNDRGILLDIDTPDELLKYGKMPR